MNQTCSIQFPRNRTPVKSLNDLPVNDVVFGLCKSDLEGVQLFFGFHFGLLQPDGGRLALALVVVVGGSPRHFE
jgi:hypothetical protein